MRVSIFGLGYVGAVSCACLASDGHVVVGVDPNATKVDLINTGQTPVVEERVGEMVAAEVAAGRLSATTSPATAVAASEIAFVCVGTPSAPNGSLSLQYLERACRDIGEALRNKDEFYTVVIRSTVLPGTTRNTVIPAIEESSGKEHGVDFGVCMNPEFLREASAVADFYDPPKVVIGGSVDESIKALAPLVSKGDAAVVTVPLEVAEMVKYVDNNWHALKVAFGNEVGRISKAVGVSGQDVMDIFCLDEKLNLSAKYLNPGMAFGGSCLPKDVRALAHRSRSLDLKTPILDSLIDSNEQHLQAALDLITASGPKKLGVLGLSFKAGTDDLREAPMVELAERLSGKGYWLNVFDENVNIARLTGANKEFINQHIPHIAELLVNSAEEAIDGAEVVIIGNSNPAFVRAIDAIGPGVRVIDLVGLLEADSGAESLAWS